MKITKNRIVQVDALRGIALFGILLAHMVFWYNAGPLPNDLYKNQDIASNIIAGLNEILIAGKFFAFFSFLFGLSFFLQMQSMEKTQINFVWRYAWRIIILGIIGLIHHAFWQGDILSIYAPLGILLIPMRKLSNKAILIIGILFAINVPTRIIEIVNILLPKGLSFSQPMNWEAMSKPYYHIMSEAGWKELIAYNWHALNTKFQFQYSSGRIFITFGFFLLGMYTGRKGWFNNTVEFSFTYKRICKTASFIMLACFLTAISMFAADHFLKLGWQQNPYIGFVFTSFYDTFNAALVIVYISGLTILMNKSNWQKMLFPFSTVGKMALSCYITQTIFGLMVFYHVGFGLVGKTQAWQNWLMAIAFFGVQSLFCYYLLKKYHYGPLEWLWRSATYFKWQPFRKN